VDIARGEMVEKELDAMIERRSRRKDPDEVQDLWKASVIIHDVRRHEENRLAWCEYFCRLAGTLRARAKKYDQRAEMLMEATDERTTV
jgi:hypothetical protein